MIFEREKRRRKTNSEGSWAVSYVDMLTLLLCFFIIFYNAKSFEESQKSNLSPFQKIIYDLQNKKAGGGGTITKSDGIGTGDGVGPGVGSGAGTDADSGILRPNGPAVTPFGNAVLTDEEFNLLKMLQGKIDSKHYTETRMLERSLLIEFNGVSFFDSGSTQLKKDAKKLMEDVADILLNYKDQIRVIVQGHTDSRKVTHKKENLSDNWELSVMRAAKVLKLFLQKGFPEELLSAEGFAETKTPKRVLANVKSLNELLAYQRRVTLRIEPKRVNK
jgi:chemotaxis protein MotB